MSRALCQLTVAIAIFCVQAQKVATLDPFSSVVVCGNIQVGIKPSADNTYSVEFQGDASQFSSLQAKVKNGVVYAQNPGTINSNTGVVMIISAPPDALHSLETKGNGDTSMISGFTVDTFQIVASGNGVTRASLNVSGELSATFSGNGELTVGGALGSLNLQNSGNGAVSVFGVQGDATVDVTGNGETYIGGSPKTTITGSNTNYNPVTYSGKSCDISSSSSFVPGCVESSGKSAPHISLPSPGGGYFMAGPKTCV